MKNYFPLFRARCAQLDEATEKALLADPGQDWIRAYRNSPLVIHVMNAQRPDAEYVGYLSLTNPFTAAEGLVQGYFRLATPEEISAYEAESIRKREQILAEDQARNAKGTSVTVSPETLQQAIAGLGLKPTKS